MRALAFVFAALIAALVAGNAPAQARQERIALIIANEAYVSPNLGRLPGTQRDAALMRDALARAGFAVTLRANLDRAQMRQALQDFAGRLADAGSNGVGFFYYSGHGIADDPRGRNYLVPVDAQISRITDLPNQGLALDDQLEAIEIANAKATIVVIDACRNTPVALGRGTRGLAPVPARTHTLVAFSTGPGEIAEDDGHYAETLSRELSTPGRDIEAVFAQVQRDVGAATQSRQIPEYRSRLIEPIVFVPGAQAHVASNWRAGQEFDDCGVAGWCPRMIVIPGGSFMMGSPEAETGRAANEGPQWRATVRQFAAGKYEVTFDQWSRCAERGGCQGNPAPLDAGWGRGSRPVIDVSWSDAQEYIDWLSRETHQQYRLLSEAEWEYSARASASTPFPWGDTASHELANFGADVCCSGLTSGRDRWINTAPVGSFPANAFGLYDMQGNVWEWVQDCYLGSYGSQGVAADANACQFHAIRGGGWNHSPAYLRSAARYGDTVSARGQGLGFRVARSL